MLLIGLFAAAMPVVHPAAFSSSGHSGRSAGWLLHLDPLGAVFRDLREALGADPDVAFEFEKVSDGYAVIQAELFCSERLAVKLRDHSRQTRFQSRRANAPELGPCVLAITSSDNSNSFGWAGSTCLPQRGFWAGCQRVTIERHDAG
jgi:hypothetical protein